MEVEIDESRGNLIEEGLLGIWRNGEDDGWMLFGGSGT